MKRTTLRSCVALLLALLALLALLDFSTATDCGDGSDGSVPNCCAAQNGVCDGGCEVGYGVSADKTTCFKCNPSNCLYCDGNPNVCNQVKEPAVKNCDVVYDGGNCVECDSGYVLVEGKKDAQHQLWGVQTCVKCAIKNCDSCDPKNPKKCASCKFRYGPDGKGNCKPCKDPHCASCPKGVATCQFCSQESLNNSYGLVAKGKGKKKTYSCLPCPKGCYNCDGNNKICKDQKPSGK